MIKLKVKDTQFKGNQVLIHYMNGSYALKEIYHSTEIGVLLEDMVTYIRYSEPSVLEIVDYNVKGRVL